MSDQAAETRIATLEAALLGFVQRSHKETGELCFCQLGSKFATPIWGHDEPCLQARAALAMTQGATP